MTDQTTTTPAAPAPAAPLKKGFAVTALVLGIVAIVGSWIPFLSIGSILIGLIGLIFGLIATVKALRGKAAGKVMAIIATVLSLLSIIFGFMSTSAGVDAVDEAFDELGGEISAESATDAEDADATDAETEDAPADEPVVGSFEAPAAIGDGTVWNVEQGGDAWAITFDEVTLIDTYDGEGQVAVVTGTATPTAIDEGPTSNWVTFPMIGWMADGMTVDDTFEMADYDQIGDKYRSTIELEGTEGTEMSFYSTVSLPEGVLPNLMTVETLFGSDAIYFETGL
ncbi:DUF4190 domain-containing protein [Demequina gelatinilytica]|uniref:DUF4190 domain-containing protein n=1 Tax=Demequina gelatinilytica TaxID=1638980 RepID=UPI000785E0C7|nr:DUF4190 domain-containing protein [Demequina gelatinilytica]